MAASKWLDEDGRLFGKINLIDFLALLVLALLAVRALFPLWQQRPGPRRDARAILLVTSVRPEVAAGVRPGEMMTEAKSGAVLGRVTRKDQSPTEREWAAADGRLIQALSSQVVDLRLEVKGPARAGKGEALEFDHFPLRAGQTVTVQTSRAVYRALVLTVEPITP